MDILTELKKQLENKDDFLDNGPSTDVGQEWLSRTKELLAKVDHGMAAEFDELGRKSALSLSSLTLDSILARMVIILRNAINYIELGDSPEKTAKSPVKTKEENFSENMHKKYWSFVFNEFWNFILGHKVSALIGTIVVALFVLTYFGYAKYVPEFNFPVGTFKVGEINTDAEKNTANSDSKKLDRSVFDLAKETVATGLTSKERVNLISNISGLGTKDEIGTIEDIGTDGLTILIRGKSADGSIGLIRCDFSSSWKQRISLVKKDSEIKFIGIVSEYDLSRQWIVLKDCKLTD